MTTEPQNPFSVAHDAIAHMTDYQCRLTLVALIGRLIFTGQYNYSDADTRALLVAAAADDLQRWANRNAQ